MTKKKKDHLTLTKVYERFTRFALANPDNASTQKYVAVVHPRGDGPRRILDHSALQDASESNEIEGAPSLSDCSALQCYLRAEKGKDELYRTSFSNMKTHISVVSKWMADGIGNSASIRHTTMNSDITEELTDSIHKLRDHLTLAAAKKQNIEPESVEVHSLTADFVLDDNRQLWLCCVNDVRMEIDSLESSINSVAEEKKTQSLVSPVRPSLPSLDPESTQQPSYVSASIFHKKGSGSNAVYTCTKGEHELPGLTCWSSTHTDGTHSIKMQALIERWNNNNKSLSGPPNPHLEGQKAERSKQRFSVTFKSVLLAQESEEFLKGNIKAKSGADLASKWRKADRSNQSSLSAKKSYYDETTVDGNLYHICLKLDALRASEFEIGGPASPIPMPSSSRPNSEPASDNGRRSRNRPRKKKMSQSSRNPSSPPSSAGDSRHPSRDQNRKEAFGKAQKTTKNINDHEKENSSLKKVKNVYGQADPRSTKGKDRIAKSKKSQDMSQPIDHEEFAKFAATKSDSSPTRRQGYDDPRDKDARRSENDSIVTDRINQQLQKKKVDRRLYEQQMFADSKSDHNLADELEEYGLERSLETEEISRLQSQASMSKTERDFLNRRGMPEEIAGPPSQPSFPMPVMHHSLDNFPKAMRPRPGDDNSGSSEVVNAMRDRIAAMEAEMKTLRSKAKGAEEAALSSAARAKEANRKLAMAQTKFTNALQEKDSEHSHALLNLGSELNTARAESADLRSQLAKTAGLSKSDNINSSYQQELLKKVESLHAEMNNNQRKWNEERRKLMSEQASSNQQLSSNHRLELAEARDQIAKLEDKVTDMNESVRGVEKEKSLLEQRLADAERKKIQAIGESERLRSDVKTLQQSLQATQSLDMAQGEMYRDGESTIAALQATSDARIRTLNNKVEYLKAQLASEASLKDEYAKTITDLRKERDETAAATRNKFKELESLKDKEVTEIQEQMRQNMDGPINEVSHLQSKVAALQAQLGDAMQDIAQARKKEEAARGETSKERSRISSVQHELNMATNELESAKEEIAILKENSSNAAANEAMLRRLDNERQYLKNQLTSEVTCKNELQETLERTTRQLGEMKAAWKSESEGLATKIRQEADRRDAIEAELRTKNQSLNADVKTQSEQLAEIKEAYVKTRDQLRLDQAAVENMRVTSQRLAEELKGAQDELVASRQASEETNRRHSMNMQTVTSTVAQAEAARKLDTERLQMECRNSLQKTAEAQREMMKLREQMGLQQAAALKTRAAQTVGNAMTKWMNQQLAQAFSAWTGNLMMHKARDVASQQIQQAVAVTEEKMKEEREMACRMVMGKMAKEKEEAIKRMEASAAEDRQKLVQAAQEDINRAVENERKRSTNLIKEQKVLWDKQYDETLTRHKAAVADMAAAHEEHTQSIKKGIKKDIERAVFEAERGFLGRQNELLKENDERWKHMLSENQKRLEEDFSQAKKQREDEFDKILEEHSARYEEEKQLLEKAHELDVAEQVREEEKRMQSELVKAVADESYKQQQVFNKEMQKMREDVEDARLQGENNLKAAKKTWDEGLDKLKSEWEEVVESKYAEKLREVGDVEKDRRQKAVRLEAGKWQKALRETEDRIEAERHASFKKGVAERDASAQKEIADLKNAANLALEKVKISAKESLKQALSESANQLKLAREHAAREKEEAIAKGLKEANEERMKAVEEAIGVFSKNAEKKKVEAVEAAVARETMATRRVQAELESVTASWRRDQSENVELKQQIDHLKVSGKSELKNHLMAAEEAAAKMRETFELRLAEALKRQKVQLDEIKAREASEQDAKFQEEKDNAVRETQKNAEKEMEAALGALEAESEKLISSLEQAMAGLRRSKKETEDELAETKSMLEENEDTIYDLQQEMKMKSKEASFNALRLTTGAIRQRINYLKLLDGKDQDLANEKVFMQREHERSDSKRVQEIQVLEGILEACKQQRELMHETLVNHKRETLVEHKVQSGVISRELEQIAMERDAVEGQREALEGQLKTMEDNLKDLEDQINVHSKTSTIQGGRVNVSHARKKRRLDEEFEQLLDNIENKRSELSSVDAKLKELMENKEDAEDRMKGLERMLVEVLVEQQKKLLSILSQQPEEVARQIREGKA